MAFTIEVTRREKNEEFEVGDLELFHQECMGGRIKQEYQPLHNSWLLTCKRCGVTMWVDVSEAGTIALIKTAIDGEKRNRKVGWDTRCPPIWFVVPRN